MQKDTVPTLARSGLWVSRRVGATGKKLSEEANQKKGHLSFIFHRTEGGSLNLTIHSHSLFSQWPRISHNVAHHTA